MMAEMKEKLIELIFKCLDHNMMIADVIELVDGIEELYDPYVYHVDWASIDSEKWGELEDI